MSDEFRFFLAIALPVLVLTGGLTIVWTAGTLPKSRPRSEQE